MNAMQKAAFLTLLPKIQRLDAMQARNAFKEAFEVDIDHHEFGYYLDELYRKGLLVIAGRSFDRFILYKLNDADLLQPTPLTNFMFENASAKKQTPPLILEPNFVCGTHGVGYAKGERCWVCEEQEIDDVWGSAPAANVGPQHWPPFAECEIHGLEYDKENPCPACLAEEMDDLDNERRAAALAEYAANTGDRSADAEGFDPDMYCEYHFGVELDRFGGCPKCELTATEPPEFPHGEFPNRRQFSD